jgi:hypothetical protein
MLCILPSGGTRQTPNQTKPMMIETKEQFAIFRILQLRAALRLECAGMRHSSGRSVAKLIKQQFGFKGSKQAILEQLCAHIEAIKAGEAAA